jgi:hypothetical protein
VGTHFLCRAVARDEQELAAVSEFLRKVSQDVGEDFALAALSAANVRKANQRLLMKGSGART